ncbi:DeoR/GlpR family DNA-binding transcription regulator [Actinomadura sp. WMMB 499]|uniref:DeoR/GlpR family DNA-binding transcription regulator n=1 Tax=Actinomadura sp. WMMB 499 TaxID=1219491 RepID=UPI001246C6DA|nr:DeoR/GlpR family DNA-binding transcription regulator [Actinomadura sp. WMMB 499]QFG26258.1 DeoR/GlpR transcriptional regulator [Actinomadura sp. WMMB 499]
MSGDRGPAEAAGGRQARQLARQRAITEAVMAEGAIRIDELAERFGISQMTVHRDLDELAGLGVLRKQRGVATALATSLVESSDVYRSNQQMTEKESLARAALDFISPGQALFLDDSTTVLQIAPHLRHRTPLTVITNVLTLINQLQATRNITLLGLGGQYYNWCSAFMGRMTIQAISNLQADTFIMSTAAITGDVAYHQSLETVDIKRAMFDAANVRILLADHTKFEKRALHALVPLSDFDTVIVDAATPDEHIKRMQAKGIHVVVAPKDPRPVLPTAEEQ